MFVLVFLVYYNLGIALYCIHLCVAILPLVSHVINKTDVFAAALSEINQKDLQCQQLIVWLIALEHLHQDNAC